jgi:hypothetical protein
MRRFFPFDFAPSQNDTGRRIDGRITATSRDGEAVLLGPD